MDHSLPVSSPRSFWGIRIAFAFLLLGPLGCIPRNLSSDPAPLSREYAITVEDLLIAPTDERGRAWDSFGAPEEQLQEQRRKFDAQTAGLFDQQCWPNEDQRWVCIPTAKAAWLLLVPTILDIYRIVEGMAREKGTYKPDARITLRSQGRSVVFPTYPDSYQPTWKRPVLFRLQPSDPLEIDIDDVDPLGSQPIASIRTTFLPTKEAFQRGRFRLIFHRALNAKHLVLEFAAPGAP